MKKTIFALATAATLAVGTLSAPTTADARCYGCAVGAGVAAGVIGGAIIGGAIASNSYPYGGGYYGPGYGYGPGYYDGGPYGPCVWQRQRFWDGYGWRARNVRVCE